MPRVHALLLSLCLGSLVGCGGDDVQADTGETEGGAGGRARGISIVGVEANQGAGVLLSEGDQAIAPEQRNAHLVSYRDTLIRFQHVIDDPEQWIPRELIGRLHVRLGNGGPEFIRERRMFVEADSDPRMLTSNFFFSVLASEAQVGAEYWVELLEADTSLDLSALDEGVVVAPAEPAPLGFEPGPLRLRVVVVPVDYRHPDPPRIAAPTADDLQLFHDHLLQQNPLQHIEISVREQPLVWEERVLNLGELLVPTAALKLDDGADANVYYHSLLDVGGTSVNMVAGIAFLANDSAEDSLRRVAATVFHKPRNPADKEDGEREGLHPPTASARTWVHEIGHNQGLSHVYCPGADAANPDQGYPYEDGKLGTFGFGIRDYHIYTPTAAHDYMTYCGNSWVSDWTWNKTYARIRTLTSWDEQGMPLVADPQPVLLGLLFADGSESWWVAHEPAPRERSGAQRIEYRGGGRLLAREWAEVSLLGDASTLMVRAVLPQGATWADIDELVRVDHREQRHAIADVHVREAGVWVRSQN